MLGKKRGTRTLENTENFLENAREGRVVYDDIERRIYPNHAS